MTDCRRTLAQVALGLVLSVFVCLFLEAQARHDGLRENFENPPQSAKPRVWWHWMNGNISKEGIRLDLEWMHRVGIGGFQNFDAALNTPQFVEKRLVYMTPGWKEAFRYATSLADQLGLEEAIAGSPGWSESGGPWVKPSQGMKKLVWSETVVNGGHPFSGVLPHPPDVSGPYQNIPIIDFLAVMSGQKPVLPPTFYADTAVIAYREHDEDVPLSDLHPRITSSSGTVDAALLDDGDLVKPTPLARPSAGREARVQYEFSAPHAIRAVTLVLNDPASTAANMFGAAPSIADFQASDDGVSFRKIVSIPNDGGVAHTIAFPVVRSKFFRVAFAYSPPPPGIALDFDIDNPFGSGAGPSDPNFEISELVLHTGARVSRFEEKAGFANLQSFDSFATPPVDDAISKTDVVDLTEKVQPDGTLHWTPPPGRWTVLRFGYSLTGVTNHPASPEDTGLEVDKLDRDAVAAYMKAYLDSYQEVVRPLMGKRGLQYVINDSWEAGTANWTGTLIAEFTKRRGYDPRPWMPVLAGRVVESSRASDQFLWDFRRTLSDLLAENHYDQINQILHARGLGHYGESHEEGRAFIGDGMEVKRGNDVPMAAMWTQKPGVNNEQFGYNADIRESASVAHIYGQNLVAAESLTASSGAWAWSPATLKPTADKELAMGLNRFVIHTSVHQPLTDRQPGFSLGPFGQWFNRNETWAEQAQPWITYLARCSYLLQQGHFVADIAYFYGEDTNLTALFGHSAPDIPPGYNFDYVNADALLHVFSVCDGALATPSGMRYRLLVLDPASRRMSVPVLRKIRDLVNAGAIVVGAKPVEMPSLSDDPSEFTKLTDQLWSASGAGNSFGKGRIYGKASLAQALSELRIGPDFEYAKANPDISLLFVHRQLEDADLYFVDNRNDRTESVEVTLRVSAKSPELWHPDTGATEPASYKIANGRTTVPLRLEPWGTLFIVLRQPAGKPKREFPPVTETTVATIQGPWEVTFQPGRGAPERANFESLTAWNESADAGIKYFSGTATYSKEVHTESDWFRSGVHYWLDLGDVKNLADVTLNGTPLGIVWKKPYRVDITSVLKAGSNQLQVRVTNGWANRIIGDRQPNATKTYTFTSPQFYKASSRLWPSGLLGPVHVIRSEK